MLDTQPCQASLAEDPFGGEPGPPTQFEEYDLASCETPRFDEPTAAQLAELFALPALPLEKRGVTPHAGQSLRASRPQVSQSEFWAAQTIHKNAIAAKLRQAGQLTLAAALEDCHSRYTFGVCGDCGRVARFPNRCDRFYCPECQPRLSHDRKEAVEWWTTLVTEPKHVVLTTRNTPDLSPGHIDELRDNFTKLRRTAFATKVTYWWVEYPDPIPNDPGPSPPPIITQIRRYRDRTRNGQTIKSSPWRGGFYSFEVTNESRGWHLHIHALVDADYISKQVLAHVWSRITNTASHIVEVKDARGRQYLQEVTKYACKGSQLATWTPDQIVTFILAFSSKRTFGVFGSLYGARTEFAEWVAELRNKRPKCECGSCNVKYYSEPEYLALGLVPNTPASARPPPQDDHQPELHALDPNRLNAQIL
jgi:hypothetical protein